VPHIVLADDLDGPVRDGKLGDVAPTILRLLGQEVPDTMDGTPLVGVPAEA
jgi:2,3-bisphosphoglycerate-independent phosphoglycerate mutase